jgi:hypothetical protein
MLILERDVSRLFSSDDESIVRVHDQITHLLEINWPLTALTSGQMPTREHISQLIDTAFWASHRSNEGRTTRFCLVVSTPEGFPDATAFEVPVPFDVSQIARLAPAVPEEGCLAVSGTCDGMSIWGLGRSRPESGALCIDVWEPGTVRVGIGPFPAFAVLGRSNAFIKGTGVKFPDYLRQILSKTFPDDDPLETQAVWRECLVIRDLARMIVADGHGGIVLVVPGETGRWSESLKPFEFRFAAPDNSIHRLIRDELREADAQGGVVRQKGAENLPDELKNLLTVESRMRSGAIRKAIRAVASLAAVDGAIVITRYLQVLGFGAKIAVTEADVPQIHIFRPLPGNRQTAPVPSVLENLGGMRHQSAARFVNAHRDTVALVISQDRHLSVVHWQDLIDSVSVLRNAEWCV